MSYLIDGKVVDNLKDDPEYQKAAAERQREYERNELLDRELALDEPEIGRDVMVAAAAVLKRRGIVFKDATQEQFAPHSRRCRREHRRRRALEARLAELQGNGRRWRPR